MRFSSYRGYLNLYIKNVRWQVYYPDIHITKKEIYFQCNTIFRAVFDVKYFGIGFSILGFGFGFERGFEEF